MKKHEIDPNKAEPTGEGYFTEDTGSDQAGCDIDTDRCAPDDYVADDVDDGPSPGTQDDLPYSYGEQKPGPADEHIVPADAPVSSSSGRAKGDDTSGLGDEDAAALWRRQKHLIEEDEDDGIKLPGFSEDEAEKVLDALGEEVADPLPDAPNGVSATGSPFEPEHGGFPERED